MEKDKFTSHIEAIGNFESYGDIEKPDFYYEIRWDGPMSPGNMTKLTLAVIRNLAESTRTLLLHL